MINHKQLHLVPQMVQDRVQTMLNENFSTESREIYVQQIEVIRDYCTAALDEFNKMKTRKHVTKQVRRKTA